MADDQDEDGILFRTHSHYLNHPALTTTVMDEQFNVVAALFLDGRSPLQMPLRLREWPTTSRCWNEEKPFRLEEKDTITDHGYFRAKLVMGREEDIEVVWSGAMPDQAGGFTKGELLGSDGYENSNTASIMDRARLSIMFGRTPGTRDGDGADNR